MEITNETRRAGGAAGLGKTSSLGNRDIAQNRPTPQAEKRNPAAVREVKRELLREALFDLAGFVQLHSDVCQTCAQARDDFGTIHAITRLIGYAKELARTGNDLRAILDEAAAERPEGGQ